MHYKKIALDLIEANPELHSELRANRTLLVTVERLAAELKTNHEAWKRRLASSRPDSDPIAVASEAMEMASHDLENRLSCASAMGGETPLCLDEAMRFIRRPSSNA